jgi:hypothetical protein
MTSSSGGTVTVGPCGGTTTGWVGTSSSSMGTSSFGGTTTAGPCGTRPSSSSGGTASVSSYDSETSSTTCMHFALGTSSSSCITCVINWSGKTSLSQRQRRRSLDSLDGAMARF